MKRLFMVLVLMLSMILAACGGGDPTATTAPAPTAAPGEPTATTGTAPEATEATSGEAVEITVWATGSEDEGKVLNAAAEEFTKVNPNVKVKIQPISWDDAHAKILSAATSQVGPDIITGGLSWGIEFGKKGGMIDLKKEYPDAVAEIEKAALPAIYNSVVSTDGEVFGVPWDLTLMLMYYRPDLLKEATGSDAAPATWDELTNAIKKVQEKNKKGFAMQWGNTQWLQYFNYLYAAGGSLYDAGCTKATINSPEGVAALKFYADLYNVYKAPTDGWPDLEGGLDTGDYPVGITGSWVAAGLDSTHPDIKDIWKLAPLPKGPSGKATAFIGGRIIGVMSFSKFQKESAEFIRFIYSAAAVDAMAKKAAEVKIFYIHPSIDYVNKVPAAADRIEAVKAQMLDSSGPPNCTGWEESARTVEQKLQEVIFNQADPQAALDEAAATMDENLAQ